MPKFRSRGMIAAIVGAMVFLNQVESAKKNAFSRAAKPHINNCKHCTCHTYSHPLDETVPKWPIFLEFSPRDSAEIPFFQNIFGFVEMMAASSAPN